MVPRAEQNLQRPPAPRRFVSNSKASFNSPSPSFEADDERSILGDSEMDSDSDYTSSRPVPQYPGEDTRTTSRKELFGWYSYGWASEVFVVCGVGSFIPITLEQLARQSGALLSDHKTPCGSTARVPPGVLPAVVQNHSLLSVMARGSAPEKGQCFVKILGVEVSTASFAMYTFSLSVLFQALVIVSMSGAADHGRYRKKLLLTFAFVGALATMLFLPVQPHVFVLGAFLAIVSNTCFGASNVLMNSFLPLLVRRHPSVQTTNAGLGSEYYRSEEQEGASLFDSTAALLPTSQPTSNSVTPSAPKSSPELLLSTKISSYGVGIGYIAAVILQIVGIMLLFSMGSTLFSLRLVLFTIGLWWVIFTIPAALFLRPRPGPPLVTSKSRANSFFDYLSHSWSLLGRTILQARRLRDLSIFLIAWFLLSDALATVSSTAILFAKTELLMTPPALAFISVIATLFGVCGAFAWSALSRYFKLTAVQTLAACIALFELIPLYGLLGFIPAVRNLGVFGLQQDWEMYVLGAVYGLVLGGVGSYCRSLFGELIPPGSEAAFYALYAITDKGSSIFGPAIVGAITDHYGGIRPAFIFLAILVGLPLPLMMIVDIPRGRAQSRKLVNLEGSRGDGQVVASYRPLNTGAEENCATALGGENMEEGEQ